MKNRMGNDSNGQPETLATTRAITGLATHANEHAIRQFCYYKGIVYFHFRKSSALSILCLRVIKLKIIYQDGLFSGQAFNGNRVIFMNESGLIKVLLYNLLCRLRR